MSDLRQMVDRPVADALRRTVGGDQLGMLRFQIAQLTKQAIVFQITDFRFRRHIVLVVVIPDQSP